MILGKEKREALLATLKGWLLDSSRKKAGIPFEEFESTVAKLRHAFTALPEGRGHMSPCNRLLRKRPEKVYLHRNAGLRQAIEGCRTMMRESMGTPTRCNQLVMGWPDVVGIVDASLEGAGGVVVGEAEKCVPTVFRLEWPDEVKALFRTKKLTNSDLEMAGLLLLFLVTERVGGLRQGSHVALFSDNTPTVGWAQRLASKRSVVAGVLVQALAMRMKAAGVSPITPLHIKGAENYLGDIPSRSFGSEPKWHCRDDSELLTMFNNLFPLPSQNSWTVFRVTKKVFTRVCSVLQMKGTSVDAWRRLSKTGSHIGEIGAPSSGLWGWTTTCGENLTGEQSDASRALQQQSGQVSTGRDAKSDVARFQALSRPCQRCSPWPSARTHQE